MFNFDGYGTEKQGGKSLKYFSLYSDALVNHGLSEVYIPEFERWITVDSTIYCTTYNNFVKKGLAKEGFEQRAINSCSIALPFFNNAGLAYTFEKEGLSILKQLKMDVSGIQLYDNSGNLFKMNKGTALLTPEVSRIIELPVKEPKKYAL
jgi:hypothetical protein